MYAKSIVYVGILSCTMIMGMERNNKNDNDEIIELTSPTGTAQTPVEICLAIEQTRKQYNQLSLVQRCRPCSSGEKEKFVYELSTLRTQKKESKTQNADSYGSIHDLQQYSFIIDQTTGKGDLVPKRNSTEKISEKEMAHNAVLLRGFGCMFDSALEQINNVDISNIGLEVLPLGKFVEYCPNLISLNASRNRIHAMTNTSSYSPHDTIRGPYPSKKDWRGLETLDISYNQLKACDLDSLFATCPHIQKLDLSNNENLETIILEGFVAGELIQAESTKEDIKDSGEGICDEDDVPKYRLPILLIANTKLLSSKQKLIHAYINTLINERVSTYSRQGGLFALLPSILVGSVPYFMMWGAGVPGYPSTAIAIGGAVVGLGGTIGVSIGHIVGRYAIGQSEKEMMEKYAENQIRFELEQKE